MSVPPVIAKNRLLKKFITKYKHDEEIDLTMGDITWVEEQFNMIIDTIINVDQHESNDSLRQMMKDVYDIKKIVKRKNNVGLMIKCDEYIHELQRKMRPESFSTYAYVQHDRKFCGLCGKYM